MSSFGGFPKWRYPKMDGLQIWGYHHFQKPPFIFSGWFLPPFLCLDPSFSKRSTLHMLVSFCPIWKLAILRMGVTHGSPRPLLSILKFFEKSLSYFGYVWIIAANCRVPPFSELPTLHQVPLTPFQPHDGCAVLGGTFFQSSDMLQNLSAGAQFSENRASSTMLVPEIIWNPLVSRSISKVAQWYLDFVFPP